MSDTEGALGLLRGNFARGSTICLRDRETSYQDTGFFEAVENLSLALTRAGVRPQERVAVLCERDTTPALAMLSLWKIGAVYVPVSATNPQERLSYILGDCDIEKVIVSNATRLTRFDFGNRRLIDISQTPLREPSPSSASSSLALEPQSIAYIIYTSGTTGRPKGVVISHGSVNSILSYALSSFSELEANETFLQTLDFSFDVSIWDTLLWCTRGGTLFVSDSGRNIFSLAEDLVQLKPTYICNAAPTYSILLSIRRMWENQDLSQLKTIITTASYCTPKVAREVIEAFPNAKLYNCYGPTETTIYCCATELKAERIPLDRPLSIGPALPNLIPYFFDGKALTATTELPEASEGELCMSGPQIFVGYWNAPELTQSRVLKGPRSEIVYRTGDWVRKLGDEFLYLGRIDDTVKVNGYRVNLGEIEHQISALDFIESCAVLSVTSDKLQTQLIAFYSLKKGLEGSFSEAESKIKDRCVAQLPPYSVPKSFKKLETFSLNTSGKIDRNKLREMI